MSALKYLDLSKNEFNAFESSMYLGNNSLVSLDIIDMRSNALQRVNYESFKEFHNLTQIMVDNEATCCLIESANCTATIPPSQFLTCGRLLSNQIQRILMWIFGLFAVISNVCALVYRCRQQQRQNKVQLFLISNLSMSDLVMGLYMLMIASADVYYHDYFPSEAWRSSITCRVAGALSMLSSEASVFFVTLLSVDRFMGIRYMYSTKRLGTVSARVVVAALWVFASVLSIISTVLSVFNPDLYDNSEVCTGLPLSRSNKFETTYYQYDTELTDSKFQPIVYNNTLSIAHGTKPGVYFGIAVFTILNFIAVWVILFCYIGIFITVKQTAREAGRNQNQKEELKMAVKMGLIVLTDMMCWLPIIILSILVQTGRQTVSPYVYTWIVTVVLPINSAINPFLYTLATAIFGFIQKRNARPSGTPNIEMKSRKP